MYVDQIRLHSIYYYLWTGNIYKDNIKHMNHIQENTGITNLSKIHKGDQIPIF